MNNQDIELTENDLRLILADMRAHARKSRALASALGGSLAYIQAKREYGIAATFAQGTKRIAREKELAAAFTRQLKTGAAK